MRLPSDLAERLEGKLTLTFREASQLLNLSLPTMYEAARNGSVPVISFGARAKRIPVGALLALCGFEDPHNAERTAEAVLPESNPFPNGKTLASVSDSRTQRGETFANDTRL